VMREDGGCGGLRVEDGGKGQKCEGEREQGPARKPRRGKFAGDRHGCTSGVCAAGCIGVWMKIREGLSGCVLLLWFIVCGSQGDTS
jgi:hypothetical protein